MIILSNGVTIDSGDITNIETIGLRNGTMFFDRANGLGIWDAFSSQWVFLTGTGVAMAEVSKTNTDLKSDGFQSYLEMPVDAVFYCENNGKSQNGQLDKTYSPTRYYGNFDTLTTVQTIKLFIKI